MDALYTDDERLLRQTIRDFSEAELAPLAAGWDEREEFPWASVEALKRMDLMGLTMPVEYGGSGASYTEMVIVAEEVARVIGAPRMATESAVRHEGETIGAARITRCLVNALAANPLPTNAGRKDLWDRVATDTPTGTGVQKARNVYNTCHDYAEALGEEGFRGCLQYHHDYLMQGINDIYWNRNDVGS